jgi:anti-anti-sigma factor
MPNLADEVWALLNQSFTRRLVLEMHEVPFLHSYLIGQLVLLGKRLHAENGLMRICGLSAANQDTLRACHLESRFPLYSSREDAVMASRPIQPR